MRIHMEGITKKTQPHLEVFFPPLPVSLTVIFFLCEAWNFNLREALLASYLYTSCLLTIKRG